jgi:flavodoxin I
VIVAKVILVYASISGNTEEIANLIAEGIREMDIEPVIKDVFDVNATGLENYDGILLGSYTWGDGDLADDFLDFYDEMDDLDLNGKSAAAFGSGDHAYQYFCAAVDILQEKLEQLGAKISQEGLKIEMAPSNEERDICKQFGKKFAESLISVG